MKEPIHIGQEIFYEYGKAVRSFRVEKIGRIYVHIKGGAYYWEKVIDKKELLEELSKKNMVSKKFFSSEEELKDNQKLREKVGKLKQKIDNLDLKNLPQLKIEAFLSFFEGIIE